MAGRKALSSGSTGKHDVRRMLVSIAACGIALVLLILIVSDTAHGGFEPSPFTILDDATGGDCTLIGSWDSGTKTCTLTGDISFSTDGIIIGADGVTLDGDGHSLTGSGGSRGVYVVSRTGVSVRDLSVTGFDYGIYHYGCIDCRIEGNRVSHNTYTGIYLSGSNSNLVRNNTAAHNEDGIMLVFHSDDNTVVGNTITLNDYGYSMSGNAINNTIVNNSFVDNTTQASVSALNTGSVFSLAAPVGGNYWSDYDTPPEGCSDTGPDGFCDSPYTFMTGQDDLPWTVQDGWCTDPMPSLGVVNIYWANMTAYLQRNLSVDFQMTSSFDYYHAQLTGTVDTNGVVLGTQVPLALGDSSGGIVGFTLVYNVPNGVSVFSTKVYATADDCCGNSYSYPGPSPL